MTITSAVVGGRRHLGRLWQRLVATFAIRRRPSAPRQPPVGVGIGRSVRVWQVQLATSGLALAVAALVASARWEWTVAVLLAALMAIRPSGFAPVVLAVATGAAFAVSPPQPVTAAGAVGLVHLLFITYSVAGDLPRATRIELVSLADPLRRFIAIQAVAQPISAIAVALESPAITVPWLAVVAMAAVGILVWWLLTSISASRATW